jgi:L-ribulose-5-phosphate 3-epimerase
MAGPATDGGRPNTMASAAGSRLTGFRNKEIHMPWSRRTLLSSLGAAGLLPALPRYAWGSASCPFRLSVINDEISQDFDLACSVAARDFGLQWIELRGMWNKNLTELDSADVDRVRGILEKYKLRVTDIASPLFKTDWPGAPQSKESPKRDQFHADFDFKKQDELLERCIALAGTFGTDRIRCFDFWRLEDQQPYREAIDEKLRKAAVTCAKSGLTLLLENEMSCNTATGEEAARTLAAVTAPNFMLNWDPGNAATFTGNTPYPNGYNLLPKGRIGHCHCKDVVRKPDGKWEWAPVGAGVVDWVGQFRAFERDGYRFAVSLETHWRGAGTPEASTRVSMKGLKDTLAKAGTGC